MNSDLKKELERRVPDSEIPPLPLGSIRERGRRLQWRHQAVVASSGLFVAVVLGLGMMILIDEPRDPEPSPPSAQSTTDEPTASEPIVVPRNPVVSLKPNRVRPGDRAELRVHRSVGYGLAWVLERYEGSTWEWAGVLKAGPGKKWEKKFDLPPLERMDIEDIGLGGPASMLLQMADLPPGRYRLGQDFLRGGKKTPDNVTGWHYAEFEVLE